MPEKPTGNIMILWTESQTRFKKLLDWVENNQSLSIQDKARAKVVITHAFPKFGNKIGKTYEMLQKEAGVSSKTLAAQFKLLEPNDAQNFSRIYFKEGWQEEVDSKYPLEVKKELDVELEKMKKGLSQAKKEEIKTETTDEIINTLKQLKGRELESEIKAEQIRTMEKLRQQGTVSEQQLEAYKEQQKITQTSEELTSELNRLKEEATKAKEEAKAKEVKEIKKPKKEEKIISVEEEEKIFEEPYEETLSETEERLEIPKQPVIQPKVIEIQPLTLEDLNKMSIEELKMSLSKWNEWQSTLENPPKQLEVLISDAQKVLEAKEKPTIEETPKSEDPLGWGKPDSWTTIQDKPISPLTKDYIPSKLDKPVEKLRGIKERDMIEAKAWAVSRLYAEAQKNKSNYEKYLLVMKALGLGGEE